jgi:sporulation protein YlmC with PRC-barrel domain
MTVMTLEDEHETVLTVEDRFEMSDADELHDVLLKIERDRPVTIDFRSVRRIEDFVIARLAQDFTRTSMRILGLSEHQHRIVRYFAPEYDAGAPRRTPERALPPGSNSPE